VEVKFRDRTRTVKRRLLEITKVLRRRTGQAYQEVRAITGELAQVGQQALAAAGQILDSLGDAADETLERLQAELETMVERTQQVIDQALEVNAGNRSLPNHMVSVFDPDARPIPRGKRDVDFGFKVQLTENKQRVVTAYDVLDGNPADTEVVLPAVREHTRRTGKTPRVVATDRGCTSADNERTLHGNNAGGPVRKGRSASSSDATACGAPATAALTAAAAGSEAPSGDTTCSGSRPCCRTRPRSRIMSRYQGAGLGQAFKKQPFSVVTI